MATPAVVHEAHKKLKSFLLCDVRQTGTQLGSGSYGTVEELEMDGLVCAGKKIHDTLANPKNLGAQRLVNKFYKECSLLSNLCHPHIVQFLGICFLPDSRLPVLVTERMDRSLDDFLESIKHTPSIDNALPTKLSILRDVACGLVFLHGRAVIHRDLTSRNVLLNSNMIAKIADLGNSRIVDSETPLTEFPGAALYMPPEASSKKPYMYGQSLDMFSFGHLSLYTAIGVFPNELLGQTYEDPITKEVKGRSEIERREKYIVQLEKNFAHPNHALAVLIKKCLDYNPSKRPSAQQAMQTLLEEMRRHVVQDPYIDLNRFQLIIALKQREEQLRQLAVELSASRLSLETKLKKAEDELEVVHKGRDELMFGLQLQLQDGETADQQDQVEKEHTHIRSRSMTDTLNSRDSMLAVKSAQIAALAIQKERMLHTLGKVPKLPCVKWEEPVEMLLGMEAAQAVLVQGKVYIGGGTTEMGMHKILEYTCDGGEWREIETPSLIHHFGMGAVNDKLVITGGLKKSGVTNEVWVLDDTWEPFPAMNNERYWPSAVGYKRWLVVVGGDSGEEKCIEVLDTLSKQWYKTSALPHTGMASRVSVTIAQDTLYVVSQHSAVSILVPTLISDALSTGNKSTHSEWEPLADTPTNSPAITPFDSTLLAVGASDNPSSTIAMYIPLTQQWLPVSQLPTPRRGAAVIILPETDSESGTTMMVVGGVSQSNDYIKTVNTSIMYITADFK